MVETNEWTQLLADLTELRIAQQERDAAIAAARRTFNERKQACEQKYRKIHLQIRAVSGTLLTSGRDFDGVHWGSWAADVEAWRQGVPVDFQDQHPLAEPTADEIRAHNDAVARCLGLPTAREPDESLESWERRVDALIREVQQRADAGDSPE
jgi:hypothetical protein